MSSRASDPSTPWTWTRRSLLRHLGGGLALAGFTPLAACGDGLVDDGTTGDGTTGGGTTGSGTTGDETTDDGATGADTTGDATTGDGTTGDESCEAAGAWASGGTAAMTEKRCYPDPFAAATSCLVLCETTEGPCTADTIERQDVSEGFSGLPIRLALKIVAVDSCAPVAGAVVEIWHTQRTGVYSGVTPSGAFCYGDDPEAESHLYFRGTQTSDADGRVDFDTCFPGWYGGRAIHIHFRIYLGGERYLTSQLFFDEALTAEIFNAHPEYAEFGQPDTINSNDNIIGGVEDITPYLLETARMADGAMLASKIIAIPASAAAEWCSAGMAGPPP
ncbi:MAG: hypothetical protein R3A51_18970 [Nannocystaceae bacterium]